MNWDDLKIIAEVRNQRSYTRASKVLEINETTVARRITRIQSELGFLLFDAVNGVRKPTIKCQSILAQIDDISQKVKLIETMGRDEAGPAGNFRIASTASIAESFLAPGLSELLKKNQGISIEIQTSDDDLDLSRWQTDLALRLGRPQKGLFTMRKLARIPLYLIASSKSDDDVSKPMVCAYPQDLEHTPEMRYLASAKMADAVRLQTSNLNIIRSVIQSQDGIGILPEHMVGDMCNDNRYDVRPLNRYREVWLLIQPHLSKDPAARLVIDWIVSQFEV